MAKEAAEKLVEEYAELFKKAVQKMGNTVELMAQKTDEMMCDIHQWKVIISNLKHDIKRFTSDMSPTGQDAALYTLFLEIYLWVSICLIASSLVSIVFGHLFAFLLTSILSKHLIAIISLIILPHFMIAYLLRLNVTEENHRMNLFGATILHGLMLDSLITEYHLDFYSPPTFLLPMTVAVMTRTLGLVLGTLQRSVHLTVNFMVAIGLYSIYGQLTSSLCPKYYIWSTILCLVASIDAQVKYGRFKEGPLVLSYAQTISVITFKISSFFLAFLSCTINEQEQRPFSNKTIVDNFI